jgi:predicted PP-loop superfamily ATPase
MQATQGDNTKTRIAAASQGGSDLAAVRIISKSVGGKAINATIHAKRGIVKARRHSNKNTAGMRRKVFMPYLYESSSTN